MHSILLHLSTGFIYILDNMKGFMNYIYALFLTLILSSSAYAMNGTDWIVTGTGGGTSTGNDEPVSTTVNDTKPH